MDILGNPAPNVINAPFVKSGMAQWVTKFDGVGMYGSVPSMGVLTAPRLVVEAADAGPVNATMRYIAGRVSGDRFYLSVLNGNLVVGHGSGYQELAVPISDGRLRRIELAIKGAEVVVTVDGVEVYRSTTAFSNTLDDVRIGKYPHGYSNYWEGEITSVQFYDEDTLLRDYRFDRTDGVIRNYAPSGADGVTGWGTLHNAAPDAYARYKEVDADLIAVSQGATDIPASDLYKLRKRIARLLEYKAGKSRVIPRFDGVGMYGDIPAWTASGDYELQLTLDNNDTDSHYLLGGPESRVIQHQGLLWVGNQGKEKKRTVPAGLAGLQRYKITHVNGISRTYLNAAMLPLIEGLDHINPFVVERIGGKWGLSTSVPSYNGHIAHVALIDLENPLTNSRLYLMDDATGILYDALSEKGSELWDEGEVVLDDSTSYFSSVAIVPGSTYVISGLPPNVWVNSGTGWYIHNNGVMTAVSDTALRIRNTSGNQVTFTPSIKEAPNAGQIQNAPADAYPQFVYQGEHKKEWLGVELVSNGRFDSALSDWLDAQAHWAPDNGRAYHSASTGYNSLYQGIGATVGAMYRVKFDAEILSGDIQAFWCLSDGNAYNPRIQTAITESGSYSFDTEALQGHVGVARSSGLLTEFYIDNLSARELLKEA